jgi:hypothetical protein
MISLAALHMLARLGVDVGTPFQLVYEHGIAVLRIGSQEREDASAIALWRSGERNHNFVCSRKAPNCICWLLIHEYLMGRCTGTVSNDSRDAGG